MTSQTNSTEPDECDNCQLSLRWIDGDDHEEQFRKLRDCHSANCDKKICDENANRCFSRKMCDYCANYFCSNHTQTCEECNYDFCAKCKRFSRDPSDRMCNKCFVRETLNLEPDTKFSDSESEEESHSDREPLFVKNPFNDNSIERACQLSDLLRRIYSDDSLTDAQRRERIYNRCIVEWQDDLAYRVIDGRSEPKSSQINRKGEHVSEPASKKIKTK